MVRQVASPLLVPQPKQVMLRDRATTVSSISDLQRRGTDSIPQSALKLGAEAAHDELVATLGRLFASESRNGSNRGEVVVRYGEYMGAEPLPEEGYVLDVDADSIDIVARDAAGFRHAVRTLRQLSNRDAEGGVLIRNAKIRDWPSLRFRGVHLFTGNGGPETHKRILRDVVGALKMNHVVLESEYICWDSHPEIHHEKYGMPKSDVREVVGLCRELGIGISPLVQSLGHCEWIFERGENLAIAEDPDARWAYCVTNPATYEFIYDVFQEAIALFEPEWLHIGHDEFTQRGRVPHRPKSRQHSIDELFLADTMRLHGWLRSRGVKTMMWGDMLLSPGEAPDACHALSQASARSLRDALPKDIRITDWHYAPAPPEQYRSLSVFGNAGFPTIAATWCNPTNITNFAQAAYRQSALGLLQTTWAGFSLDEDSVTREVEQYSAHVLAAEAAWNAHDPPDPDTYDAKSRFLALTGMDDC